jgi:hypothetical protein
MVAHSAPLASCCEQLSFLPAALIPLTLAALALITLLTSTVLLTWLITKSFLPLGLISIAVVLLIRLALIPLLVALISLTALTLSSGVVWQWVAPFDSSPHNPIRSQLVSPMSYMNVARVQAENHR